MIAILGISTYELARCARVFMQLPPVVWHPRWGGINIYQPAPDYRAGRTIYPYSVVPGGVQNATELEASMAKDPVVAAHYRDISVLRLQAARLNAAVDVYASFRLANSVHWTSHTIRIPKGELILTDGAHMIRARCGNRLTFVPPGPVWPTPAIRDRAGPPSRVAPPPFEPPELVFDYGLPAIYRPPVSPPPEHAAVPVSDVPHFWPPATAPPTWCCELGGFPGEGIPVFPSGLGHRTPRPPAIPEPGTLLLFGSGVIGLASILGSKLVL